MKIIDKKLHPFSIKLVSNDYDILEDTGRVDKNKNKIFRNHGHYSSTENALKKIQKLLVEVDATYTLKEYMDELKRVKIQIEDN